MGTNKSEVVWQLEQIRLQYEAAERGLTGLAQGTARHQFITARMEQMGKLHEELVMLVGAEQATRLFAETLENA
jgi:hypothetical protein